jgi:predicted permease
MSWWSKLVRTVRPGRHDEEIEEELDYHLAMKEREGVDARTARLRLGNPARLKEETRAQGILTWLESAVRDVSYGWRQLRRTPTVTLVVVLTLALGIGANSAIFSLVDAALLKRLPVKDAGALRLIEWTTNHGWPDSLCHSLTGDFTGDPAAEMHGSSIAPRIYRELARKQSGFSSLIGFSDGDTVAVSLEGKPAEQLNLQYVSANFFQSLGVAPRLGRTFSTDEDRVGQAALVVISERLWRSYFGGRESVLGRVLRVSNVPVQIIGVAPRGFFGVKIGVWEDLYAPLAAQAALSPRVRLDQSLGETDSYWWVRMLGRPKPGAGESQAMQQLSTVFQRLVVPEGLHIAKEKIPGLIASPGERGFDTINTDHERALWIILLLVGLILLIVCANIANLLLARAVARQRESAICLALGAARLRLLRQYLIESLTLAAAGGLAGFCLSYVLAQAIQSFVGTDLHIGDFDLAIDSRMLSFTLLVSLATALLFGLAPAWQLTRASVHDALKANNRNVTSGRLALPRALVAIQIGISFTILMAAGLLGRSLANLKTVNIGFNRENLVYASFDPWSAGYGPDQVRQYAERLGTRLAAIPGVLRLGMIEERPLSGNANGTRINIPGQPYKEDPAHGSLVNHVGDGLFETLGIPLLAGRVFDSRDMRANSDAVVVDDLFVQNFYPHQNPLGQQFGTGPKPTEYFRIIGVVKRSRYYSLREAAPIMFQPMLAGDRPGWPLTFAIRSAADTRQLAPVIRKIAAEIDPSMLVTEIKTQTALIDNLLLFERLLSLLSEAFGTLAIVLSAIGLIGLLGYTVARRTNEIGVRMAIGASRADVIQLVLKDSLLLVIAGIAVGLPGAFFLGKYLKHVLFDLPATDPATAALSLAVLVAIAGIASWIPAWRAARIDPMGALREE